MSLGIEIGRNSPAHASVATLSCDREHVRGHVLMMSAEGGGRGGTPKANVLGKLSKGGCVKMQTRGGGQNYKKIADVICSCPLSSALARSQTFLNTVLVCVK